MKIPDNRLKLVCLTGLLCDQRIWQDVASCLEPDVDVEIMSFAGFDDLTDMAHHVLSQVSGSFALAGHSMGGRVALEICRLAVDRVTHLALMNTGVHPKSDKEIPGRMRLVSLAQQQGTSILTTQWLRPMMSPKGLANEALMATLERMVSAYSIEDFEKQINALIHRPNAESVLPLINVPTLLLSGTEDTWSPVSQHQLIQRQIVSSELVVVDAVGHMAPVEDPQAVAGAMRAWLSKSQKV